MANRAKLRKRAEQLKGRPVCITLHDGRSYVGWITSLDKEAIILSRAGSTRRRSAAKGRKAEVSAFMPLLGSFMGGAGGAMGFGRIMGMFGMVQKAMPVMKMGYNMIKSIRPFMSGLKGLMG
ncbi:hypothetical protein [Paenibacillus sp. MMS20-IR301]|uniref:hypothetical protein n=1 Tax=Paenibacillus sp. MMS20-IR301 TaxID=2895946 RepID=UPI0028ED03A3|nr:hypothetical protein [Paenibacillus sp. MMS20-IR301]WNS42002.1 hypothetical protein LOS79_23755 [Paenibacillus sp. MMS20-IR301]